MENGHFTRQEIQSQPQAWSEAIKILNETRDDMIGFYPARRYGQVIFTGCGSTYYLALSAAALNQELTGLPSCAHPASELWLHPKSSYTTAATLLVAISRSGETTETLRACEAFLENRRGGLITLSCYGEMPLAKLGGLNIVLPSGQEQSVAQTRAFSTLYLGTVALACLWADRPDLFDLLHHLPEAAASLIDNSAPLAEELGRDETIDRFYWLGGGPRYGLASELSLKMKEMSLSHSEPFHFLEFRHGPKSMVTSSALTIGLRSSLNGNEEGSVLEDIRSLGGRVVDIGEAGASVQFDAGLDEAIQNVLYLPIGQMVAFERSLSKGLNPDFPTNLDTVVRLS